MWAISAKPMLSAMPLVASSAKLRKVLVNSTIKLDEADRAKSEADVLRARLAKLEATLDQTSGELIEAIRAQAEAEAGADAVRGERDELRATVETITDELREAHRVADVRRDAAANNGPAEVADAVTATPTGSAERKDHRPEVAEGPTDSSHSGKAAAKRQKGWNPNFSAKAVELYWHTVQTVDADLAAGRITTRQAAGRKATARCRYNAGAKPVNCAGTARVSAA